MTVCAAGIEALLAQPPTATSDCLAALPPIVRTHYQRVSAIPWEDYDLAIEAGGPLPRGSLAADDELLMTNPSVICHQGRLLVAVRVMSSPQVQPPCTDIWRSHVVLAELAYSSAAAAADGSSTQGRMLTRGCAIDVSASSVEAFGEPTGSAQQQVCCTAEPCIAVRLGRCTAAPPAPQRHSLPAPPQACAGSGLAPSVGLGDEDPRLVLLGGVLHAAVNGGRAQPTGATDCASAHRQRAMRLMPLLPLGPPLELRWPAAAEVTDRNWLLFEHEGRRAALRPPAHGILTLATAPDPNH